MASLLIDHAWRLLTCAQIFPSAGGWTCKGRKGRGISSNGQPWSGKGHSFSHGL